jgi:hypothetical protein
MKKLLLLLFAGLLSLLLNGLKAQEVFQPYKTNAVPYHGYLFPVIPETEEWINLGSFEARLESVQLPIDTLENISTARLLETCIYCPFFSEVTSGATGFQPEDLIRTFGIYRGWLNCAEEYFNRPDCLSELLSLYSSRQIEFVFEIPEGEYQSYDRGHYSSDYCLMETMMYYMSLVMDLSQEEKAEMISLLHEKMVRWELYHNVYSSHWVVNELLDLLSTGIDEFDNPSIYPNPTNDLIHIDYEITNVKIYNIVGQLVKETKENVIDLSEQQAGTYILKVFTPSGVVTKQIIKN